MTEAAGHSLSQSWSVGRHGRQPASPRRKNSAHVFLTLTFLLPVTRSIFRSGSSVFKSPISPYIRDSVVRLKILDNTQFLHRRADTTSLSLRPAQLPVMSSTDLAAHLRPSPHSKRR